MLLCLLLAWAAAVPAWGQAPWATEPRATCGPGSCYALFPRRRTFLEAWRACRELGGDLATPRTPEEANRVASLVGSGPADKLLWIGLQRPPRQCPPQRPLRGFTWTTGDQDTAFTNWAQPATDGPCPAQRCAALEAGGGHRWLEGSCTLAVDGYLCQFGFEGACPALAEEEGQAGPAVYTTPFHLVSSAWEWLPFGSVAAVPCRAGGETSLLCMKLPEGGVVWSQAGPLCPATSCDLDNGGCEHQCVEELDAGVSCRCPEGSRLAADGRHCEDPCAQAPCEHQCELDGPHGYRCHCRLGFRPAEDEPHRCVDTDECQIPGVCQQMCVNYIGGFECYCGDGLELMDDGVSCSPAGHRRSIAAQGLGEDEDEEEEEDEEEDEEDTEDDEDMSWESFPHGWTEEPGAPWMDASPSVDFGAANFPDFLGNSGPLLSHWEPTQPPPPRGPYHSSVLSVTRAPLPPAPHYPRVPARPPALPSARQPLTVSAASVPRPPAHQNPWTPARVVPPGPLVPLFPTSAPHQPSGPQNPLISTEPLGLSPSRPSPPFPAPHVPETPHSAPVPATRVPLANASTAPHTPVTSNSPLLQATTTHFPRTPTALPPPTTTSKAPGAPAHHTPPHPDPHTPRWPQSSSQQTSLPSAPDPHSKVEPVPREGTPDPPLAPWLTSAAPTALGEASLAGRSRRDDRWLLVALLVPTCVFLVVLLALGIVYCTRCGPHAPNKRVTNCYRWVTQAGSKGPSELVAPRSSLSGVQTCRTSV
ncbi:endosialin [Sorex araneus]|uniref:endosialin n=1 Tax=Sorex araneus TaxID=42254 RepID=UPI002433D94C|nr:endosialin [Sorex araneus]